MPWQPEDAPRHTHKADTPHLCRLWSAVANSVLVETRNEGLAVRAANAAVARSKQHPSGDEPEFVERDDWDRFDN
jgi:hypothetical protein